MLSMLIKSTINSVHNLINPVQYSLNLFKPTSIKYLIKMEYNPPPKCLPSMDITDFLSNPKERQWQGPFSFILGADTQFGLIAWNLLDESTPNWSREITLTRDVITAINKMTPLPRFFCICGDMLDAYPFSTPQPPHFRTFPPGLLPVREEQYKDFVEVFKQLDPRVKLICVCGNHDMGDIPNREAVQVYRRQFGQDYFAFWVGGVKFVVLNSQYIFAPEGVPEETEKQWKWIDTIKDPTAKYIVVFQHVPYFVGEPNEPESWNLNIPRPQRFEYLEKLRESGVRHIFCGHYHKNAGGFWKDVEQVVTGAIGAPLFDDPSGYRVVNVEETGIEHEYIPIRDTVKQK